MESLLHLVPIEVLPSTRETRGALNPALFGRLISLARLFRKVACDLLSVFSPDYSDQRLTGTNAEAVSKWPPVWNCAPRDFPEIWALIRIRRWWNEI